MTFTQIRHIGLTLGSAFCFFTIYLFFQHDYYNGLISLSLTIISFILEIGEYRYKLYRDKHPICNRYIVSVWVDSKSENFINSCSNCALNENCRVISSEDLIKMSEEKIEEPVFIKELEETEELETEVISNIGVKTSVYS